MRLAYDGVLINTIGNMVSPTMCFDIASNRGVDLLRSVLRVVCGSSAKQRVGYLLLSKDDSG